MRAGEVVGCELGGHTAPTERQPGTEHGDLRARPSECAQYIGEHAGQAEPHEHERDRQPLGGVAGVARRRAQCCAEHAEHDRAHGHVLVAPGVLVQHALADEQQHQQSGGQRRLHDHQRRQHQCDHLQRPAEQRQARAEQPARAPQQVPHERHAQVLLVRRLAGVHRLQGNP